MKPLALYRRLFTWLCICPPENGTSKQMKSIYVLFSFFVLLINTFALIMHTFAFLYHGTADFMLAAFYIISIVGASNVVLNHLAMIYHRKEYIDILDRLSAIYDECKWQWVHLILFPNRTKNKFSFQFIVQNRGSIQSLERANIQSERMWILYAKYVIKCSFFCVLIQSFVSIAIGKYLEGEYVTEHAYYLYHLM